MVGRNTSEAGSSLDGIVLCVQPADELPDFPDLTPRCTRPGTGFPAEGVDALH
ncbi:hypothetical protein PCASD_07116 [Puccinia coronata f. sp. avenae]|uniref:Uncharacterized protein n=1 Tax=Puccinia coronata f. sp. avenae TaxID=200324 RepID=A0A2N5V490_9BASI|nr:hypothetical protein PCASD_07116 [Puccinia coronata f. sp. avenae]